MGSHPIRDVLTDSARAQKDSLRNFIERRMPLFVYSIAEVASLSLPNTAGLVYDGGFYEYDVADTTTAAAADVALVDLDGRRFLFRSHVDLSPARVRSTHTGDEPNATRFAKASGGEGGELRLEKPTTTTAIAGDVSLDLYNDQARLFDNGNGTGVAFDFAASKPAVIHTMRTTADGKPWSILSWINGANHSAIRAKTYSGDLWSQLNSAFNSGEDIYFPPGQYKITDWLNPVRQGQRFTAASRTATQLYVDQSFNMARGYVFGGVPYSHVENLFIQFYQPAAATTKSALYAYPWAFRNAAQRSVWKSIGWGAAYNGMDAAGIDSNNHAGASLVEDVWDGSLNIGLQASNIYDFFKVDKWHSWEWGYEGNANVRQINYSEAKYGAIFGANIETLICGDMNYWMSTFRCEGSSIFKRSIGSIKLDGWASSFQHAGSADTLIGKLDILCDKNTDHNLVLQQGGNCSVGALHLRNTNAHNGSMIRTEGGRFLAAGGVIQSTGNGFHSETVGGTTHLSGVKSITGGNTARTLPFHKQTGSAGTLVLDNCEPDAIGSGSGQFAVCEGQTGNRIVNNDFKGYRLTAVTAVGNLFGQNLNVGSEF